MALDLDTRYDPKELEPRWLASWEKIGAFDAEPTDPRAPFTIVIPPPNVTGVLHLGHAMNNTFQDMLVRFHRMRGKAALWMPGTDHAGIATQNVVEKALKKEGKKRQDLGREKFLEEVWKHKEKNGGTIIKQLRRIGASCDWRRERFTMDEGLSRAVLEVFVRLYRKGLIYRGERLVNWCPRCTTALSDEEAEPRETEGGLYRIKYPIEGQPGRTITIATTRPETMLGDTGIAVHPDDARYTDLVGKNAILPLMERPIPIVADSYVDMKFGTGCLKVTPAHDLNDFEVGARHELPLVNMLTPEGKVSEAGGKYAGMDRFDARKKVLEDLEAAGLLEGKEKHTHNVPRCQRCDTIVEYYLSKQWFVKMQPLAEPAIKVVEDGTVKFVPERWSAVYLHWMKNIRDWCISRQLWWGHRIPVWYRGEEVHCGLEAPSGEGWEQDPDVLDTWFSSWLWPFSTMGWPETTPLLEKFYPTDVLVTGHEIIFFWVARMIMAGLEFMGKVPFTEVSIHGIVRDEQGRKMSKSLGNGIDPLEVVEETSADALRFTIAYLTPEGQDVRVSKAKFEKGRNFCTKLWNAARLILGSLEGFRWTDAPPPRERPEDRWIISRLHSANAIATRSLEEIEYNPVASALYDFTWAELCDWWLEIAKARFVSTDAAEKAGVQHVAAYVLDRLLRLLHPIAPFITSELWEKLRQATGAPSWAETLMTAAWPEADPSLVDEAIEARFALLTSVVSATRNIRQEYKIKPGDTVKALVTGGAASLAQIEASKDLVMRLAKLESLEMGASLAKPKASAAAVVNDVQIFVPLAGIIDVEAEKARILKKLEEAKKKLAAVEAKLAAPSFADKAPAEVVEATRKSAEELRAQIKALEENLRDLG